MVFREYGNENDKVVVLLHGGGLAGWGYESVAQKLSEKYHIILPDIDGHGDSDRDFISIENNAQHILEYINNYHDGKVFAIGGLSLGGQIALEILSQKADICEYAFIESALVVPSKFTEIMVKPLLDCSYFLINKPWFAKMQFDYLKIDKTLFEHYYRDSCKITKNNMISFLKANTTYRLKQSLNKTKAKVIVLAGGKEQKNIIRSSHLIADKIPESCIEIIPELYHGQLSMNFSERYISIFNKYIKQTK